MVYFEQEQDHDHEAEWRENLIELDEQWLEPPEKHRHDDTLAWIKHPPRRIQFEGGFRQSHEAMLRARFNDLVRQWRKSIGYKSSLREIVFNRAYLAIILLAVDDEKHQQLLIRFILEELRDHGGHWFWALHSITGASPAGSQDDFHAVRDAWIKWGKTHGYLEN